MKEPMNFLKQFFVFLFLLGLDLCTKFLAVTYLLEPIALVSFKKAGFLAQLRLVINEGIALNFLSSFGKYHQLMLSALIGLVLVLFVGYTFFRFFFFNRKVLFELMVLAGGLGNFISRFFYHGVVDFIEISLFGINSSVFNLADLWIGFGLFYILMRSINESA